MQTNRKRKKVKTLTLQEAKGNDNVPMKQETIKKEKRKQSS